MPREANPLVRKSGFADAEKFYVLAYEGTVTERIYFENLRHSDIFNDSGRIETIPLKKGKNVGNSPLDVKTLLSKAKSEYNYGATDEFWLIIDRDDWGTIHHIDMDALCEDCRKERNFHLALSNPCFEIWLILHLRKLSEISPEDRERIYINPAVSAKHHYIDTYLSGCICDGRGYNKRPKAEVFMPKVYDAIANAKEVSDTEAKFPAGLGSDVFRLVEKLVK